MFPQSPALIITLLWQWHAVWYSTICVPRSQKVWLQHQQLYLELAEGKIQEDTATWTVLLICSLLYAKSLSWQHRW